MNDKAIPESPLELAAHELAGHHRLGEAPPKPIAAWQRAGALRRWLDDVRQACVDPPPGASKAAEWLLDNDYQVYRALQRIEKDLPRPFYRQLLPLSDEGGGLPRIYSMAIEYLHASHMQISLSGLVRFVQSYQHRLPLRIAELWAFPTMLRIACVEILVSSLTPLLEGAAELPIPPIDASFEPLSLDPTECVARAISNLGVIAAVSWEDFFDDVSLVERVLSRDPSRHYAQMDFETRDEYRGAIEHLARTGKYGEREVAEWAIQLAREMPEEAVGRHVGYWLIDRGRPELEREVGATIGARERLRRLVLSNPGIFYAIAAVLSGACFLILPAFYLMLIGASAAGWLGAMAASLIPASVLSIAAVNWLVTRTIKPRILPKLNLRQGLPSGMNSFVVVPVAVASKKEVPALAQQLEAHWLANVDPRLQVALLADLADAPDEHMPGDLQIVDAMVEAVRSLNRRYGGGNGKGPFHLLFRPRRHNPCEGCWMAWERKRGKLEQFNRLLLEGDRSPFSLHEGNGSALRNVRYVLTVDADTLLPPGSLARLVGTIAHPLNCARMEQGTSRITRGFGVIQPRVEISPQAGNQSLFARLFTGETAIDIYSRAVSDVYQDLFGAGIFVGKGIYDVAAFHAATDGRVPEGRILSHDLFEGAHSRAALATDIVLYENFPRSYPEYARRLHRWIRGDWQLLAWLWPRVPDASGKKCENQVSGVDRWKIFDNLRRSLIPPALLALALAGWFLLPGSPWFWTALVMLAPGWQLFSDIFSGLARGRRAMATYGVFARLVDQAGRWLQLVVYLLNDALLSLHAIGVTLWRSFVSHRHLLQWTPAAQVAASIAKRTARASVWREMWAGSLFAAVIAAAVALLRPTALPAALPLLAAWIAAPEIALFSGRPRRTRIQQLGPGDADYLRLLARKTWYYFERFAGPQDNWLPPDNYQGPPHEDIGHRTSPTNIGMLLMSTAAAWDLGYLGRTELTARGRNVLDAMARLERYRGHFLNWYETRHLHPLEPRYVSTVDSGNLAVGLIAYAETLREAAAYSRIEPQRWDGLGDLLQLLDQAAEELPQARPLRQHIANIHARAKAGASLTSAAQEDTIHWIRSSSLIALEDDAQAIADDAGSEATEHLRDLLVWLDRVRHHINEMHRDLGLTLRQEEEMRALADDAVALASSMDFSWLYDRERRLFFIGYNVSASRVDTHHYDLLASEARMASFFAIAKRDVPIEHWSHLERPVTRGPGGLSLISWNGSMFEYLMPRLLLRGEPDTLLGESERVAVEIQREYGRRHGMPWGVSESAYAERDPEHHYRYQAFGVPGLGLKRGLARDQVVAPYASALALAVAPRLATANLRRLSAMGAESRFGMWEALDFTPDRKPSNREFMPVVAYMAHHQGMIMCAIANVLMHDRMVARFGRDPQMRLASLLLSERIPHEVPPEVNRLQTLAPPEKSLQVATIPPWSPDQTPFPQVLVLGNGRLSSWISDGGGGTLRWQNQSLTRFAPDATRDADGMWLYVQDTESENVWSATRQPTGIVADEYSVIFQSHLAEFHRRDHGIDSRLEVCVGSGDDLEIRRLTLINESNRPRRLRLTSYAEVVLAPPLDDERHPAFSKLFTGGEFIPRIGGLLFKRRPRKPAEMPPCMVQFVIDEEGPIDGLRYEVDRRAFIGRGRTTRNPLGASQKLGCSVGWTLDPIAALQFEVTLQPGERRVICLVTAVGASPSAALEIAARHATLASMDWVVGDAANETARAVSRSRIQPGEMPALQSLSSLMVHPHGALRASPDRIRENRSGQGGLWGLALSGDLPILLLRTRSADQRLLPLLAGAHQFWRRIGLQVDLVILQTAGSTYTEPLRGEVHALLREIGASEMLGRHGGIHLFFSDQSGSGQVANLEAVAWAILDEGAGTLAEQLARTRKSKRLPPPILATLAEAPAEQQLEETPERLLFFNETGGFTQDAREYVIRLEPGQATPSPWANVLANDSFGTLMTETGGGFTWSINSGENRLTPWTNDPVSDRPAELLYLRDEETVAVWTVTPGPGGQEAPCEIRHGSGYTQWRKSSHGIVQEQRVFVPRDDAVKLVRLRLRNTTSRPRRITATYYAEWLLGSLPSIAKRHVTCRFDESAQAILANSVWNADFADRVAFLTATLEIHGFGTDREAFLGREGDYANPAALHRWGLAGTEMAGADACAAYQVHFDLAPDADAEATFILGDAAGEEEVLALATKWRSAAAVEEAEQALTRQWDEFLTRVSVETPDPAFNVMINRWLIYQSLSSRVMARAGFYQASGAIGFRDQLQDVLALMMFDPQRVRAHILACAAHQFEEGDVLHWWHPPANRGVRTRFSDDLLWLPYVTAHYVQATGDEAILEEVVPFLSAPPLGPEEHDRYSQFSSHQSSGTLIEHCERALERVDCGANGLPLMGTGDWNDGMDRVGDKGRGESVWLAWFAAITARLLADLERRLGRQREAEKWEERSQTLLSNAEESGWDGAWYRRAYDDEGHPLGSARHAECRIDSISQSWAVFAGANPARTSLALEAACHELIDRESALARLLWPPFDKTSRDPGYIAAYPPGLRENGSQYSHAAAWLGLALAQTGDPDGALEIFHMICPVRRGSTPEGAGHYRIEPYIVAGDIATYGQHSGKGGWSWYTGAAAWTWRLGVEGLLGLTMQDGGIRISPALPRAWPGYSATLRRGTARIEIEVLQSSDVQKTCIKIDGEDAGDGVIEFPPEGETRKVKVICTATQTKPLDAAS